MLNDFKSQLGSSMHTVRRFLQRPISVKQGSLTLGVPAGALRAQAREERRQRVSRMRRDLYQLMEQHPSSRQLMRHLDLVERTLRRDGLTAMEALPVRVIAKGLVQLERLVWDWSPIGLAELRSRMAVIVKSRPAEAHVMSAESPELDVSAHHVADVTEVDHAAYEEMERSWAGRAPSPMVAEVAAVRAEM